MADEDARDGTAAPQEKHSPVRERFHGRVRDGARRSCAWAGCREAGEFRAPANNPPETSVNTAVRPVEDDASARRFQWFCLDHVREFNASYDYFRGMSHEEIAREQRRSLFGETRTRTFAHNNHAAAGAHMDDPMGIFRGQPGLGGFADAGVSRNGKRLTAEDLSALRTLGLDDSAQAPAIRQRYKQLVRQYHPDSNGGDRRHEAALRRTIDAFNQLRSSALFA